MASLTGLKMDLVLTDAVAKGNDYLPAVMQCLTVCLCCKLQDCLSVLQAAGQISIPDQPKMGFGPDCIIAKGSDYLPAVMQCLTACDAKCRAEQRP
jgi:hypothetical protein